jgi:hypothetical protein
MICANMSVHAKQPLRIYSISLPKPVGVFPWIVLIGGALIVLTFELFVIGAGPSLRQLPYHGRYIFVVPRILGATRPATNKSYSRARRTSEIH